MELDQSNLRRCFLRPIAEFALAADLLSQAADEFLIDDRTEAERCLREADLRPLGDFAYLVCGPINPRIHRQSKNPVYERVDARVALRMPGAKVEREVYARDGYRCRFCSARVILSKARRVLVAAFPSTARWGKVNADKHFGLATLTASIDHIIPHGRGGDNDPANLVTACGPCQFGRNQWTLEEVQIEDPRRFAPIVDSWDGLSRLMPVTSSDRRDRSIIRNRSLASP